MAFTINPSKRYLVNGSAFLDDVSDAEKGYFSDLTISSKDFTTLKLYISEDKFVTVELQNQLQNYRLPHVTKQEDVDRYRHDPLKFYQNQINFVLWCATSGCGVSYQHFNNPNPMIKSFFRFHVYYQTRRLLKELSSPSPFSSYWDPLNNNIDVGAYKKLCLDFHVDTKTSWKQRVDEFSGGLGTAYYWYQGYHHVPGNDYNDSPLHFTEAEKKHWTKLTEQLNEGATVMTFPGSQHGSHYIVSYITQSLKVVDAWKGYILDPTLCEGFTDIGIQKINDSVRVYVYCILGCQAQTKSGLLTKGTGQDAKSQFKTLVETNVDSSVDLQSAIDRYQNVLQYARSKLDFVLGQGLYLMPSNMDLRIGNYEDYNFNGNR